AVNPKLAMPAPAPVTVVSNAFGVRWLGQDGQNLTGAGSVHLALTGLPTGRTVAAAQLTDGTLNTSAYTTPGATLSAANFGALPLGFQPGAGDLTRADVGFPAVRDESQATLTLRLALDNGTILVSTFHGGHADPGLRTPDIAATSIVARPGDN